MLALPAIRSSFVDTGDGDPFVESSVTDVKGERWVPLIRCIHRLRHVGGSGGPTTRMPHSGHRRWTSSNDHASVNAPVTWSPSSASSSHGGNRPCCRFAPHFRPRCEKRGMPSNWHELTPAGCAMYLCVPLSEPTSQSRFMTQTTGTRRLAMILSEGSATGGRQGHIESAT